VTNHTLEKPNDWWQFHLPLVISIKSTHIPVTHLRYDTPPYSHTKIEKAHERRRNGWSSSREVSISVKQESEKHAYNKQISKKLRSQFQHTEILFKMRPKS